MLKSAKRKALGQRTVGRQGSRAVLALHTHGTTLPSTDLASSVTVGLSLSCPSWHRARGLAGSMISGLCLLLGLLRLMSSLRQSLVRFLP